MSWIFKLYHSSFFFGGVVGGVTLCCALCEVCCSLKLRYVKIRACVEQVFGETQIITMAGRSSHRELGKTWTLRRPTHLVNGSVVVKRTPSVSVGSQSKTCFLNRISSLMYVLGTHDVSANRAAKFGKEGTDVIAFGEYEQDWKNGLWSFFYGRHRNSVRDGWWDLPKTALTIPLNMFDEERIFIVFWDRTHIRASVRRRPLWSTTIERERKQKTRKLKGAQRMLPVVTRSHSGDSGRGPTYDYCAQLSVNVSSQFGKRRSVVGGNSALASTFVKYSGSKIRGSLSRRETQKQERWARSMGFGRWSV